MEEEYIANTLFMISRAAFALAVICALIAVILFFRFHITRVIGELSGRNARRSIKQIQTLDNSAGTLLLSGKMPFTNLETVMIVHTDEDIQEGTEHEEDTLAWEKENWQEIVDRSACNTADWKDDGVA